MQALETKIMTLPDASENFSAALYFKYNTSGNKVYYLQQCPFLQINLRKHGMIYCWYVVGPVYTLVV